VIFGLKIYHPATLLLAVGDMVVEMIMYYRFQNVSL
jgi:hypothetical protein